MSTETPIEDLASALAHAQYEGFPEIVYADRDWEHFRKTKEDVRIEKRRRPNMHDISVVTMFQQTWGSTALGFGGVGGAAMTAAYTIVLACEERRAVYFGGRFAYLINKPNAAMRDSMMMRQMLPVLQAKEYEADCL